MLDHDNNVNEELPGEDDLDKVMEDLDKVYKDYLEVENQDEFTEIQKKYNEYLSQFSETYLEGSEWYKFLGKDFKLGYLKYQTQKNGISSNDIINIAAGALYLTAICNVFN